MQQKILIFVIGFVLGVGLFSGLYYLKSSKMTGTKLNVSPECGVITPFNYCGSNKYLCTVSCNICGCDIPQCKPIEECVP